MKARTVVGGVLLGLGTLAAANRRLRYRDTLEPPLEGNEETFRWRGMDVRYTAAGATDDPDLILLHGPNAAGTAGEWREVFDELAEDYHVVAPDLPGFGRSDRPPLRYSAALYEEFVSDFLASFETPAVVASSLSAAYAAKAGATEEVEVAGFVAVCPTAAAGPTPPNSWLHEVLRAPLVGTALFNLVASKPSLKHFNADHGFGDGTNITDAWIDYGWRSAHVANARFAPAAFIAGYLNSDVDLVDALSSIDVPPTLVWGREADVTPLAEGRALAEAADARLVVFDRAKLLPHVEHPDRFTETVQEGLIAGATA